MEWEKDRKKRVWKGKHKSMYSLNYHLKYIPNRINDWFSFLFYNNEYGIKINEFSLYSTNTIINDWILELNNAILVIQIITPIL